MAAWIWGAAPSRRRSRSTRPRLNRTRDDAREHLPLKVSFSTRKDSQRLDTRDQLPRFEQERGIRRLATRALSTGERLVDEHACRAQRTHERRKQRPMQVVHDDDQVERLRLDEWLTIFEIDDVGSQ